MSSDEFGVVIPADPGGRRSSLALGRAVVADALRAVDSAGAVDAERETNWRRGYLTHFRRLVEAGLASRQAALTVAGDGLQSLHLRMRHLQADGADTGLDAIPADANPAFSTVEVRGTGEVEAGFSLPLCGERVSGDALSRRLDTWAAAGVLEPSAADRVRTVMAHPEWLRLDGRTLVALGASAEMGPLKPLLRWGARVAAVDLPRTDLWRRLLDTARAGAGTLLMPVGADSSDSDATDSRAGLDLLTDVVAAVDWIRGLDGRVVLGNYVYADGVTNLRLSAAVDALTVRVHASRPDLALAFLATPTDVFGVPPDAVAQALGAYRHRSLRSRLVGLPLRALSGGRLLRRPYVPGQTPGINDALVRQQGPNYALAKRLQRWRATVEREAGTTVSMNVAPPTRTRSVMSNRALTAAYSGAHRFGVEVFEPATASTLMAALLVADLQTGVAPAHDEPWQDEAYAAVHGGLWRCPYEPRSALGLAAILGYAATRA